MIELRDYQSRLVDGARANIRDGVRSQVLVAPTGAGKTVISGFIQGGAAQRGLTSWFCVHRKEIIEQTARTFQAVGIDFGLVMAGEPMRPSAKVQLCSVQTVVNRFDQLPKPSGIVFDECHHIVAGAHSRIANGNPDAWKIGVTATPERLDGKGLGDFFQRMVTGPTTAELIERGFLAPFRYFAPGRPDLAGVPTERGDFKRADAASIMGDAQLIGEAVSTYCKLAMGKRAIVFEASRENSRKTVEAFEAAGIRAMHVDGEMHPDARRAAFEAFRLGEVKVLANVEIAGEGVDIPAIEIAILRRPTKSLSLYLQQVGRALRLFEGKAEALIIDHAGNVFMHGMPDEVRQWSLEGRPKSKRAANDDAKGIHQCPECYAVTYSTARTCLCGYVWPVTARSLEEQEGELFELTDRDAKTKAKADRKAEERACNSLADFVRLGHARGYQNPEGWARHQVSIRHQYAQRYRRRA